MRVVVSMPGLDPWAALISNLDPDVLPRADVRAHGKVAAWLAGSAVNRGIGRKFGAAEDCLFGKRAAAQKFCEIPADIGDVLGAARKQAGA